MKPTFTYDPDNEISKDLANAIENAARHDQTTVADYDISDLFDGEKSKYVRIIIQPITEAQYEADTEL